MGLKGCLPGKSLPPAVLKAGCRVGKRHELRALGPSSDAMSANSSLYRLNSTRHLPETQRASWCTQRVRGGCRHIIGTPCHHQGGRVKPKAVKHCEDMMMMTHRLPSGPRCGRLHAGPAPAVPLWWPCARHHPPRPPRGTPAASTRTVFPCLTAASSTTGGIISCLRTRGRSMNSGAVGFYLRR